MKKVSNILLFLLFVSIASEAQVDSVYYGNRTKEDTKKEKEKRKEPEEDWRKSLVWGGNFQAWFGNNTYLFISPNVGYPVYKNVLLGVGIVYNYSSYYGYSQSIYGGQSYLRYTIRNSYFLQVTVDRLLQPNHLSFEPKDKIWINYLMVGGGFRQPISQKAAFTTSLMYYVNPNPLSIYPSRLIIQFGLSAGF
jgi:hypothetical protein